MTNRGRRAARASVLAASSVVVCTLSACDDLDAPNLEPHDAPVSAPEVRPDTPGNGLQFNFESDDVIETFTSSDDKFLIHFTRTGPNAVPSKDTDASGIPDFVEQVASVYVDVLAFYEGLGFRPPESDAAIADNGGDGKFDVYLVDFAGVGDGAFRQDSCLASNSSRCIGFMTEENDFTGYGYPSTLIGNRILGSHEFFHAVQAAYDVNQGNVFAEATAVWATEAFDPSLNDLEGFVAGYLDNVDRPLDTPLPGPVDPFSYGAAIFFQFLDEHYGRETIRTLWERCEDGANGTADPQWMSELDPMLQDVAGVSFADAMVDFATWNLYTGDRADPSVAYASGAAYGDVKTTPVTLPYADDGLRMYYASTQYYAAAPEAGGPLTAALVAPPDAPDATEGLALVLATESDSEILATKTVSDVTAGTETVAVDGANRVVVAVVNTAISGDSKKPGLCIGTQEEVATCKATLFASGSGGGGTGGSGGGATDGGDATDDGCGCAVAGDRTSSAGWAALFALALASIRRGRRPIRSMGRGTRDTPLAGRERRG